MLEHGLEHSLQTLLLTQKPCIRPSWTDGKRRKTLSTFYQNVKTWKEAHKKLFKVTAPDLTMYYNAIPQNLIPPPDLALIKFADAFDSDMEYQLRKELLEA